MSQASKQVQWCISKAKKEIKELKSLGKSPKHRGLLEVKSNMEEAGKHIAKAEHNFKAITHLKRQAILTGHWQQDSIASITAFLQ